MPWTDENLVNEYLRAVDLAARPGAFDTSITVAERDLRGRLICFIAQATVDAWTLVANTPDLVSSWATEFAAAYYLSEVQSYHLQPEIEDNPASVIYDRVLKQLEDAKYGTIIIIDQADNVVAVAGIDVSHHETYTHDLPVEMGGEP